MCWFVDPAVLKPWLTAICFEETLGMLVNTTNFVTKCDQRTKQLSKWQHSLICESATTAPKATPKNNHGWLQRKAFKDPGKWALRYNIYIYYNISYHFSFCLQHDHIISWFMSPLPWLDEHTWLPYHWYQDFSSLPIEFAGTGAGCHQEMLILMHSVPPSNMMRQVDGIMLGHVAAKK